MFCSWVEYQQADTDTTHTGTLPAWMVGGGVCGGSWWHIVGLSINKPSTLVGVVVVGYFLEHHRSPLWVGGGVGGLLFVNYIVDASIFERRVHLVTR